MKPDTAPLLPEEAAAIAEAEAEIERGERVPPEVIESFGARTDSVLRP